MNQSYRPLSFSLYLNYFVHGIGVIILAQNMDALAARWGSIADVAWVISMLGIGRLIVLFVSGKLSDKYGRKPFILLGIVTYISFFIGILMSPTSTIACIFGILAGIANSFLDAGTYPALIEAYPDSASTATVLLKAFISAGQFLLPLFIGFLISTGAWYGWSFIIAAAILLINLPLIMKYSFPSMNPVKEAKEEGTSTKLASWIPKSKWYLEGICFVIYGYISQATFYLISQWLTKYGASVAQMTDIASRALMSYYSIGSLCCVFFTAFITKKGIRPITLLVVYTFISTISISGLYFIPSGSLAPILSFIVGFSAAGGVMQLGLVMMTEMFPKGKGTMTGVFYTTGSIASFTIPVITGYMADSGINSIMGLDAAIALAGFVVACIIYIRYNSVMKEKPAENQIAA
ncbi:MFS transporter [Megasphaera paucivorans]|uniref:Predicted arabinose efflux permease, MFS family n=1 Tax=Megasphaera paucivorans TaxID=349095 RepID=A0A1G9Z3Q4_9FIRM|nr:MFS transporter [Megasphaera paucivorans]SDN15575.1 Predicted arabinose efflux permease, MFS family [Megasphaera paucivorans]